jgi:hypothetical protein
MEAVSTTRHGESSPPFEPSRPVWALYGHIFGGLATHAHLDHLNFKEDEASHEREASSSLNLCFNLF